MGGKGTKQEREEGRGKREEGRGKREEGRGRWEEGRGKREEGYKARERLWRGEGKGRGDGGTRVREKGEEDKEFHTVDLSTIKFEREEGRGQRPEPSLDEARDVVEAMGGKAKRL
jgi:hypothetical protein